MIPNYATNTSAIKRNDLQRIRSDLPPTPQR
jgi:hypothetical protein